MIFVTVVSGVLLALACSPALADDGVAAFALRKNVVAIEGQGSGFGFIVGETGEDLYVVTADHVVRGRNAERRPIKVKFFADRGTVYTAQLLGTHSSVEDHGYDLAILRVKKQHSLEWEKECISDAPASWRGTRVWVVGADGDWTAPENPGVIGSEQPDPQSWLLEINGLPISEGSSGGPVISADGIVAMITTDSQGGSHALSVDFIRRTVASWGYPWDLLPVRSGLNGTWKGIYSRTLIDGADAINLILNLDFHGDTFEGASWEYKVTSLRGRITGTIQGDNVSFAKAHGDGREMSFTGHIDRKQGKMTGNWKSASGAYGTFQLQLRPVPIKVQ